MSLLVEPSNTEPGKIYVSLFNARRNAWGDFPPAEIDEMIAKLTEVRDRVIEAEGFEAEGKWDNFKVSIDGDGDVEIALPRTDEVFYLDPAADRPILDKLIRVFETAAARKAAR